MTTFKLGSGWGWVTNVKFLEILPTVKADTIIIRLMLKVFGVNVVAASSVPKVKLPQVALASDFAALLESGIGTDVVFIAGGKEFKLHKAVLIARSKFMRIMFDGRFKESAGPGSNPDAVATSIQMSDVEADVFSSLVRFLYTGEVPASVSSMADWEKLLIAADRYDVHDLFEHCQFRLAALMTPENAAELLALTSRFQAATILRDAGIEFVAKNQMTTEDFDRLDKATLREIVKRNAHISLTVPQADDLEKKRKSAGDHDGKGDGDGDGSLGAAPLSKRRK